MLNFYKIIIAVFFILSILAGAYWKHIDNLNNINILDNSKINLLKRLKKKKQWVKNIKKMGLENCISLL